MSQLDRLSVWPVAQQLARFQRRGRYTAESMAHPAKMLPELARTAIAHYSGPGELVVDPMCGIGTTLVEAVHLDRRAVGVELEERWAAVAAANLEHACDQGAIGAGAVVRGDARDVGRRLLGDLTGSVDLVLTSPPYGSSVHGHVQVHGDRVEKRNDRYGDGSRANIASLPVGRTSRRGDGFAAAVADVLGGCERLLARDGRLVMTVRPYRRGGALIDLPGQLVTLARRVGLELEARHVALLAGLRDGGLVSRVSFFQLRRQRSGEIPRMLLIAHEDVLVFRRRRRIARRRAARD